MADEIQRGRRIAHIDWMRGLACLLMFQTHCYNSWLSPQAKKSALYGWSQLGGTLPAPLFIFLAGLSVALVTERLRGKGLDRGAIARQCMLRGGEIFGLAILFRVQEYALGIPYAPWTDLLRVDVLNILGVSMVLLAALCWLTAGNGTAESRARGIWAGLAGAAVIAMLAPPLWTTHRLSFLPWPLESYLNGVHTFNEPQPWLFPLFPWCAFAFAGLATGFFLFTDWARRRAAAAYAGIGAAGVAAAFVSQILDGSPFRLYRIYDYWHTSPNFFLMRCGILLAILALVYAWCRWGWARSGFSPLIQLGQTSLLVYWVHIEFVYGRFSILPKGQCGVWTATAGLAAVFLAMLALSALRTRWKQKKAIVSLTAAPSEAK